MVLPIFAVLLLTGRVSAKVKNLPGDQVAVNRCRFFEDRDCFFFYIIAKNQALVPGKDGMTLGDPAQLRTFIWQRVGPGFR